MLIVLTHIPTDGLQFRHQYETDELDLTPHGFTFQQPPLIKGRVTMLAGETRVTGTVTARLVVECDRCLALTELPVNREFDLFYLPESSQAETKGETELFERDLDFSFYQDERIDVDELVLEQLELSLPTRILCQEECRGLCQQCGTNLNTEQCNCPPIIDPRWQALADLQE